MVSNLICGSDVANKAGWNNESMLTLFSEFVCQNGLEDTWLEFLNNRADSERISSEESWHDWLHSGDHAEVNDIILGC